MFRRILPFLYVICLLCSFPVSAQDPVVIEQLAMQWLKELQDPSEQIQSHGLLMAARAIDHIAQTERFTEPLLAVLNNPQSKYRANAAGGLRAMVKDPRVVNALLQALVDPNNSLRSAAAKSLGDSDDPRAGEALIKAAGDENELVRLRVAEALGQQPTEIAVEPLLKLMQDPYINTRNAAVQSLGRFKDPRVLAALIAASTNPEDRLLHSAAVNTLVKRWPAEAFDHLAALMKDREEPGREYYCLDLALTRDPRAPAIIAEFLSERNQDPNSFPRQALVSLGTLGVPVLLDHLLTANGPDEQNSYAAPLKQIGEPAFAALLSALKDPDPVRRKRAAYGLGYFQDARAIDPLLAHATDPDPKVREAVIAALTKFSDPRLANVFLHALDDPDAFVRGSAATAIIAHPDPRAVPRLIALIEEGGTGVGYIATALGALRDTRAVKPLLDAFQRQPGRTYAQALGQIGDPAALEPLFQAAQDQQNPTRATYAMAGLGYFKDQKVVDLLLKLSNSSKREIRVNALLALGLTGDPRAIQPIIGSRDNGSLKVAALSQFTPEQRAEIALASFNGTAVIEPFYAIDLLDVVKDPRLVEPLGNIVIDLHSDLKVKAATILSRYSEPAVIPYLIAAMNSSQKVRDIAYAALKRLTGMDMGPEEYLWEEWWKWEHPGATIPKLPPDPRYTVPLPAGFPKP